MALSLSPQVRTCTTQIQDDAGQRDVRCVVRYRHRSLRAISTTRKETTLPDSVPILIVDDEEIVRSALSDILAMQGYAAVCAAGAHEAVPLFTQLCRQRGAHIAILDLMMPGVNGIDLMRSLIQIDPSAHFIISSGYDVQEIAERFDLSGIESASLHFLQKPYSIAAIFGLVERAAAS
jgi:YesN/AraC family two-component response regulator